MRIANKCERACTHHYTPVEICLVPIRKRLSDLLVIHFDHVPHHLIALADDLHVSVLNAVVHHLYIVARTALPDPFTARGAVLHLGRDRLNKETQELFTSTPSCHGMVLQWPAAYCSGLQLYPHPLTKGEAVPNIERDGLEKCDSKCVQTPTKREGKKGMKMDRERE